MAGLYFTCEDASAIYRKVTSRGISARQTLVGKSMWETTFSQPDGYRIPFESPVAELEDTRLPEMSRVGSVAPRKTPPSCLTGGQRSGPCSFVRARSAAFGLRIIWKSACVGFLRNRALTTW